VLRKDDGAKDTGESGNVRMASYWGGEKVYECGRGDGTHPRKEPKVVEPRADRIRSVRDRPPHFNANFGCIAAELNPIGYQE
jgi:hypothetical protein